MSHLLELVEGVDRNQDGKIDFDEWQIMGKSESPNSPNAHQASPVKRIKKKIPMAADHLEKVRVKKLMLLHR